MFAMTLAILALQGAPAKEPEPTLKALCAVARRLDDGIKAFIGGKDLKEAFGSWDGGETGAEAAAKIREDLAKAEVTEAKTFAVDLRLIFYSEKNMVFEVQALIYTTPTEASLLGFHGRPSMSTGKVNVLPEKCAKDAKAFGDTATALLKILRTKKAEEWPLADGDKVAKLMPEAYGKEMKELLKESKAGAENLRDALNKLKYDEVKVALNEQLFTAFGADGAAKEGFLAGKLKFAETGEVFFRVAGYRTR